MIPLKKGIETNCTSLPPHTHYSDQEFNTFLRSLAKKPYSLWLSSAEHAMLEFYSTVHRQLPNKLRTQNSTFETTHPKQLPLINFIIHTNFKPVKFSNKLELFRLGPY